MNFAENTDYLRNQSDIALPPPGANNTMNASADAATAEGANAGTSQSALTAVLSPRARLASV